MPKFGQTFLANKEQIKSANAFLHSSSFFTDHILLLEFSAGSSLVALSSAYKVFQVGGFPGEKFSKWAAFLEKSFPSGLLSWRKVFQMGCFPGEKFSKWAAFLEKKMRATYVALLHTAGVDNQVCENVASLYMIKKFDNRLSFYH